MDKETEERLREELEQLIKYLNFKNHKFLKRFLNNIIEKYFKT